MDNGRRREGRRGDCLQMVLMILLQLNSLLIQYCGSFFSSLSTILYSNPQWGKEEGVHIFWTDSHSFYDLAKVASDCAGQCEKMVVEWTAGPLICHYTHSLWRNNTVEAFSNTSSFTPENKVLRVRNY